MQHDGVFTKPFALHMLLRRQEKVRWSGQNALQVLYSKFGENIWLSKVGVYS